MYNMSSNIVIAIGKGVRGARALLSIEQEKMKNGKSRGGGDKGNERDVI